ncbi:hypothetical protein Bca4012_076841 [Brassica carinata]
MASNGTLSSPSSQRGKLQDPLSPSSQSDKLQDPDLRSSSAPLGSEPPIHHGCESVVAPLCTETQASLITSTVQQPPSVEENLAAMASDTPSPPQFVPSLGSWAKPLVFVPPATPPDPSTPTDSDRALVGNQLAALWPTLNDGILNKKDKNKLPNSSLQVPLEKMPQPELKADGSLRFPWAASAAPSPSPFDPKEFTGQETLPATISAREAPMIQNQFNALDVIDVDSSGRNNH